MKAYSKNMIMYLIMIHSPLMPQIRKLKDPLKDFYLNKVRRRKKFKK